MDRRSFFGVVTAAALTPLAASAASQQVSFPTMRHRMFNALHLTKANGFLYPNSPKELSDAAATRINDALWQTAKTDVPTAWGTNVTYTGDMRIQAGPDENGWYHDATLFADNTVEYQMRRMPLRVEHGGA